VGGEEATMIKKIFILSISILSVTIISVLFYGWHLAGQVDARFSSRRWSIPSKVFTDTMLLYPGQRLNQDLFQEKLRRMGYREVPRRPGRKGEKQTAQNGLRLFLFLNDLKTPWEKRPGFPVKIEFKENTIDSIVRINDGTPLPLLEIEPEELMLFFGLERERRQLVSIKQVPEYVIHAVLAAEDRRFFEHWGIDPRGILRAMLTDLRHGSIREGGSTITQQLAKNYFLTPDRTKFTWARKAPSRSAASAKLPIFTSANRCRNYRSPRRPPLPHLSKPPTNIRPMWIKRPAGRVAT
jgi:penicillin-binding protein 1B